MAATTGRIRKAVTAVPDLLARSFRAKLAASLLAIVGLLLGATVVSVRWVTDDEVGAAMERAASQARAAFQEWEALRVNELERLGRPFTGSIRSAVLLDEVSRGGDLEPLSREASYELQRARIDSSLVAFTDPDGQALFTLRDGGRTAEGDPGRISALAGRLLAEEGAGLHGYRLLDSTLFVVQVEPVFLGPDLVGVVAFGSPVTDADARRLGEVVGAEVCLVLEGRCAAGTPGAGTGLRRALVEVAGSGERRTIEDGAERWRVFADPLVTGMPEEGYRATAVPLGPVLAPFQRILMVLLLAGVGVLGMAVLLSLRLSRGLTRPVRELVGAAHRVADGDYDVIVDVGSRDEMGTLAGAFNDMTEGLRLKERYRGVLDKVISRDIADELLSGEIELGGETREATVLFADLRGFTGLTEDMEPGDVIGLLNGCMERLTEAVEAEGGVVDKYVGDELMAIFGAPVSRGEDAMRACRSADRMVRAMEGLNRERRARGREPVGVGIGIGTGPVVAGNMGTPSRLNYTVLGATVNLAARLCSSAGPGEVRLSEETFSQVEGRVRAAPLGSVELKGFSRSMEVFGMKGLTDGSRPGPGRAGVGAALATLGLCAASIMAPPAAAQAGGLPTLQDLGMEYVSPSGVVQLGFSGRIDLEYFVPDEAPSWIIPDTEPFFAPRARLFSDLFVGDRIQVTGELRVDRGEEPAGGDHEVRLDQMYLSLLAVEAVDLFVQAGKFASPFGGYPARHHTIQDPFVRPPLAYDWRTTIPTDRAVATVDELLALRTPVNGSRARGAPLIWGVPYQWGVQVLGGIGDLSFRGGTVNSAPAGAPETWALDSEAGITSTWVAGVGYQITADLYLDASWSRGPYLSADMAGIADGGSFEDYDQTIVGLEAVFARGPLVLRGEFFHDRWQVPNLEYEPRDRSWYLEGQVDLLPGLYAAARYNSLSFRSDPSFGGVYSQGWDWDVRRIQLATGYRIAYNLGIQAEYTLNTTMDAPSDPADDLISLQLWWRY